MKKLNRKLYVFNLLLFVGFIALLAACQSKTEEPAKDKSSAVEEVKPDTTMQKKPVVEKPAVTLAGTWTGKFDSRETTLTITSSDSSTFKGKITINYRTVINQEVEGSFNAETRELSMKDVLHSRYQGKYAGKLSVHFDQMEGTFTMDVDGKKLNFNLTKK